MTYRLSRIQQMSTWTIKYKQNSLHVHISDDSEYPPKGTILVANIKKDSNSSLTSHYQQMVGSLMYAMLGSRPDICFAVNRLSQFGSKLHKNTFMQHNTYSVTCPLHGMQCWYTDWTIPPNWLGTATLTGAQILTTAAQPPATPSFLLEVLLHGPPRSNAQLHYEPLKLNIWLSASVWNTHSGHFPSCNNSTSLSTSHSNSFVTPPARKTLQKTMFSISGPSTSTFITTTCENWSTSGSSISYPYHQRRMLLTFWQNP